MYNQTGTGKGTESKNLILNENPETSCSWINPNYGIEYFLQKYFLLNWADDLTKIEELTRHEFTGNQK